MTGLVGLGLAILISVAARGAGIAVFGLVGSNLSPAHVFLAIAGGADVISAVFRNAVQQLVVPDGLRGRLGASNILVVTGAPRLGDLEVIAATVPRFARWRVGDLSQLMSALIDIGPDW